MEEPESVLNASGCIQDFAVLSNGMWNVQPGDSILRHSLVRFHVQILAMFLLGSAFHFLLKRFHLSRFVSDILAGIVLGPSVMGRLVGSKSDLLFPRIPNYVIASLSKIGIIFFVFFAGVQMDTTIIRKTGVTAFVLGILMAFTTLSMVSNIEYQFPKNNSMTIGAKMVIETSTNMYFTLIVQTHFVGVSYILMHLKIINSQLGHLALASSLVHEVVRVTIGTILVFKKVFVKISIRAGFQTVTFSLIFILFIVIMLRKMVFAFIRRTPEGQPMKEIYFSITLALVFFLSSTGDSVGLNFLIGPLLFGLIVPARTPLAEVMVAKFNTAVSGFLLPVMSAFCASNIDLRDFILEFDTLLCFRISLLAYTIKVAVTFIGVLCCRIPLRHAVALTVILNAKGLYELGIFFSFVQLQGIQDTSGILLLLLIHLFQPFLVRKLYHPSEHYLSYKLKGLEYASDDAELRILACAHRQEDALAVIKLLQYSNPTKQSPLSIYALCLEELVSSYIPLLINHQLGQKLSPSEMERSHSQPIIDIFKYFKSQHKKFTQLNAFTAVSPLKQMHEDICWLSFDKACSLIILPFHKKWNGKGRIVSSNHDLRDLNNNVLERAPCSVGILIDKSRTHGMSSVFVTSALAYRVAALFVGGPDDREALAYALRMARNPGVYLMIVHFITQDDDVDFNRDSIFDYEFLKRVRTEMVGLQNITYTKETVRDGSETFSVIQSIVGDLDLILVGRRHEIDPPALSGISSDWIDLPELGQMGDLLASEDISSTISFLVVQQQIMNAKRAGILYWD